MFRLIQGKVQTNSNRLWYGQELNLTSRNAILMHDLRYDLNSIDSESHGHSNLCDNLHLLGQLTCEAQSFHLSRLGRLQTAK